MEVPNKETFDMALTKAAYTLDKAYLSDLKNYGVVRFSDYASSQNGITYDDNIRLLHISRWVKDTDESIIDCFKNVLGTFSSTGGNNIALIIKRSTVKTDMYLAVRNCGSDKTDFSGISRDLLKSAIGGNFNGTELDEIEFEAIQDELFNTETNSIAVVSGIPSEKSKEYVSQGIEKLLDGIIPTADDECYTLIILAEPLTANETRSVLNGYEELASVLTPYVTKQFQSLENQAEMKGTFNSENTAETISKAVTKTHSVNVNIGANVGIKNAIGLSASVGYGYSYGKTTGEANTVGKAEGTNYSLSTGETKGSTYTFKSYPVANLVEKAEKSIKRIQSGQSNGLWNYACYVLSPTSYISKNVAGYISAVLKGDESYIELPVVNEWHRIEQALEYDDRNKNNCFSEIYEYIKKFSHPVFMSSDYNKVTAASCLSTSELSAVFAFPRYSLQGLPIIECTRFGREPNYLSKSEMTESEAIDIGSAYHMRNKVKNVKINLDIEELTKHTFITGSTGSGKSNAVYTLIHKLCPVDNEHKFLVIEPAKGEYKYVFGGRKDVTVYGTNPYKAPNLLQLNPFKFPDDIHVLEHVDRLVEIFNACWAMYAAMPAILKEAVEKSYEKCGWNLKRSIGKGVYPTFATVLSILPQVIDESKYSADTSNDYKGALVTRIRSLTRGIHGSIFDSDTDDNALFNQNVIIDLSRVGSIETKSLIMGILIMKLQEFRMTEKITPNSMLRHITVLEEAHHLLRRTETNQTQESSNLQGKSVEMITNAISEMRTYGEGFIIADQSPALMDMSVIRNTNTKIILRLPDETDRQLVGKAAGLNDKQIEELSKLERSVAAVSQGNWIEPVLCYFEKFTDPTPLSDENFPDDKWEDNEEKALRSLFSAILASNPDIISEEQVDNIRKWCDKEQFDDRVKNALELFIEGRPVSEHKKTALIYILSRYHHKKNEGYEKIIDGICENIVSICSIERGSDIIKQTKTLFENNLPLFSENEMKKYFSDKSNNQGGSIL